MPALPQCVMDAVGQQRWFFAHASVGGNLLEGLADLHADQPLRYPLVAGWVGFDDAGQRCAPPRRAPSPERSTSATGATRAGRPR